MEPENVDDGALMLAYAAGDRQAFTRLYQRHRGALYRYFRRQLPADQADDCFQALWLKVIAHARRYRAAGPFHHYLYTLAHNVLMDHHRQQQRTRRHLAEDASIDTTDGAASAVELADGAPGPDAAVTDEELLRRLHALLERLPFHQREAWILKQETGMSTEDIAAVTNTTIEGVRSRLRYATSRLKAGLQRYV